MVRKVGSGGETISLSNGDMNALDAVLEKKNVIWTKESKTATSGFCSVFTPTSEYSW